MTAPSSPSGTLAAAAIREVEASHVFFVRWFRGTAEPEALGLWLRTLHPHFRMTTPDGEMLDAAAIRSRIEGARGSADDRFEISIEDIEVIDAADGAVLLIYMEQQYRGARTTRRRSMALFLGDPEAPRGVVWRHLQETWMQTG